MNKRNPARESQIASRANTSKQNLEGFHHMPNVEKLQSVPDPFALENLRIGQNFADTVGVKKLITTVPVRKPNKQDFIRVRPEPEYRDIFALIEVQEDREVYLVSKDLAPDLVDEVKPYQLFTATNRQGVPFLWPTKLPGLDGRINEWNRSSIEAAEKAMSRWVRVMANMSLGAYDIYEAQGAIPDPQWPNLSFNDLLRIAFRDKFVASHDHPVLKRLRGL
jgi:hypothetical protein